MTAPARNASVSASPAQGDAQRSAPAAPLFPSFDGVMPVRPAEVAPPPAVRIEHVSKRFGDGPVVLDDITLDIAPGEFVCLLGASGCGKSTLLNLIAGLDRPTTGHIETPAAGSAVMFQESALMPWLTARRNVELALRLRGVPRAERGERRSLCSIRSTSRMPPRSARMSCRAACANASPSPARSRRTDRCC